jgi:alkyl sulfatase BDS1-like metallo-beta-lactamase superfamily hydrolase
MNIPSDGYLMNLSRCWFYTGSFSNVTENVTADYNFFIDWGDGSPTEHYTK